MLSVRLMAANRLATSGQSWFETMSHQNGGASAMQWIAFEPRSTSMLLVEQLPSVTVATNYTEEFKKAGYVCYVGVSNFDNVREIVRPAKKDLNEWRMRMERLQENVTGFEMFREMMRGCSQEDCTTKNRNSKADPLWELTYRGDLENDPVPYGVVDAKILAIDEDGFETFQAVSGPASSQSRKPFKWSETFPNISHIGHPETFHFQSVTPRWVWT